MDAASAAYLDDVERLAAELDGGAALTDPVTGVDLLTLAAAGGAAGTARALLDRGADADGGALHAAASRTHPELVRLLLLGYGLLAALLGTLLAVRRDVV